MTADPVLLSSEDLSYLAIECDTVAGVPCENEGATKARTALKQLARLASHAAAASALAEGACVPGTCKTCGGPLSPPYSRRLLQTQRDELAAALRAVMEAATVYVEGSPTRTKVFSDAADLLARIDKEAGK